MDSIDESHFIEVDEKPNRDIEELHVAQKLRFVNGKDFCHRLGFDEYASFDKYIQSKIFLFNKALVGNFDRILGYV